MEKRIWEVRTQMAINNFFWLIIRSETRFTLCLDSGVCIWVWHRLKGLINRLLFVVYAKNCEVRIELPSFLAFKRPRTSLFTQMKGRSVFKNAKPPICVIYVSDLCFNGFTPTLIASLSSIIVCVFVWRALEVKAANGQNLAIVQLVVFGKISHSPETIWRRLGFLRMWHSVRQISQNECCFVLCGVVVEIAKNKGSGKFVDDAN